MRQQWLLMTGLRELHIVSVQLETLLSSHVLDLWRVVMYLHQVLLRDTSSKAFKQSSIIQSTCFPTSTLLAKSSMERTKGTSIYLKGGGLWFFSESKLLFQFFFRDNLSQHYFFSTKTVFFKAQTANRIFFLPIFADRNLFPKKNYSPPPPLQVKWMFPNWLCLERRFLNICLFIYEFAAVIRVSSILSCSLNDDVWTVPLYCGVWWNFQKDQFDFI